MKLPEVYGHYKQLTTNASERVRQLAYAGIAIVWLFEESGQDGIQLTDLLLAVLVFFALGLMFDVLQPLIAAGKWHAFARSSETRLFKRFKGDWARVNAEELGAPAKINRAAERLFWLRNGSILAGYLLLIVHLVTQGID